MKILKASYLIVDELQYFLRYCCKRCPFHMPLAEVQHDSLDASMGLAELKASYRFLY